MRYPLLSIITINQNNADGLTRTLASLEEWRLPDVEFVFVDGASTDGSLTVANRFYRKEEVRSEPDRGIYHAMNKGILRATGKMMLFLNSGDCLLPGSPDIVLPVLRISQADIDTFGTRIRWICSDNAIEEFNPGLAALPRFTLPHQSTFFRREVVLKHDGYNEAFLVAGDRDLILRLYVSGVNISHYLPLIADFYSGGVSSSVVTGFEDLWIDVRQGRRSMFRLLLGWLRRPPGRDVSRFFSLALQHLIWSVRKHRRLSPNKP